METCGRSLEENHVRIGCYEVTQTWVPELSCRTFGLRTTDLDGTPVELNDISTDRIFVEELAHLFEREMLEPVHLRDVVEDILADQELFQEVRENTGQ